MFIRVRLALLMFSVLAGSVLAADPLLEIRWRSGAIKAAALESPQAAAAITELVPNRGTRHIVVQLAKPLGTGQREQLAGAGVTLLDYLGDNAFFAVVSSDGVSASKLAEVKSLAGVSAVEAPWKMHPLFVQGPAPVWGTVGQDKRGSPIIGTYVLFHPDVALRPEGVRVVEAYGAVVQDQIKSVNGLVIEIALSQVAALAAEDVVEYIEPALPPMEGLNAENRALTGANTAQASPYNLDGSGVTVLVYDAGKATNVSGATHPDVAGRMTIGDSSTWSDHAAHVACTVGGSGSQSLNLVHRGMAPGVDLVSYGFQWAPGGIFLYSNPGDIEADYTQAITLHGADLANNSIGTNTCSNGFPCNITGDYGVTAALIDNIVGGSLGAPFRVLWANGNERACGFCPLEHQAGYHSTAPPSCAKNHITVGAVNSDDDSMTFFSSWGPCDDGRLKPDIVGPGCEVGFPPDGVTSCNTFTGDVFFYSVKCGTSMATPTVTGLAALLLQDFRAVFPTIPDFNNATLKVLLAHNAVDIGNVGPDYQSGYGSVRIVPTIDFMRSGSFVQNQVSQGETFSILSVVNPGDPQLKVTLAWDDVAGTPLVSPALVNDLDLRVFDSANVEFFPWTLDPANPALPAVQTQADHLNNIEQVVIDAPVPGAYRVEVFGFNVPQGPQTFSLAGTPQLLLPNSGTLAPLSANIPTGTQHTLTATFREGSAPFDPIPGTMVTFEVLSGPNVGILPDTPLTDVNGQATITYTGANIGGIDQVRASFDDAGTIRFSNTATVTWAPGQLLLSPDGGTGNVRDDLTLTVTALLGAPPSTPIPGALVTFEVISGPNTGILGTATTDAAGVASITYTSADLAGMDNIRASFFDAGATRFSNTVTQTWTVGIITLSPNFASTTECAGQLLTADVVQGAPPFAPMSGVTVTFDVLSGPNTGLLGTSVTDVNGVATFTHPGDGGSGTDTIQASFIDGSAAQPSNTVTVFWAPSVLDCNLNATPDECEIGWDQDCNSNGAPDLCDLMGVTNFGPKVALTADMNPGAIVVGELNGLPGLDIAIGNNMASTTSVLINNGDGTFAPTVNYPIDGGAAGIVMADFDGDGDQDLAIATGKDTVSVLMNNGDGTFAPEVPATVWNTNGDTPTAIATGDLDGINGPDLVVGNKKANGNGDFVLTVMLNDGSGGFPATTEEIVFDFPQGVAVGDMNGDSFLDIVTAGKTLEFVKVLLNDGNAVFSPPLTAAPFAGSGPVWVTLADYDGDADLDAAFSLGDNSIHIMLNDGGGTLSGNNNFPTGVSPTTSVAKDLDNDGDLDLVVANAGDLFTTETTITVLINRSNGIFAVQPDVDTGTNNPIALAVEDFNLDGDADIVVAHDLATGDVSLLPGNVTFISLDCNANGIPDECEPDADGDTVPDPCDLCPGTFPGAPVDATGCPPSVTCSSTGTIVLNAATYPCADTAFIQVVDCDLNVSAIAVDTVDVTLASTTQPGGAIVTLTETAIDSGIFEGGIPLSTAIGVGILQIGSGDVITATYTDADDGLGGTNIVIIDIAAIGGDCLDVTVELESVDTAITRTVTFVVTDCTGAVTESFTTAISFDAGIPLVRGGQGSTTLTLLNTPGADWISANEGHVLRHRLPLGVPLPMGIAFTGGDRLMAGDFSGDGLVDIEDLSMLASRFNTPGDAADADGDGVQDTLDFTAIVVNFFLVGDATDGCP